LSQSPQDRNQDRSRADAAVRRAEFLELAAACGVLRFGEFELKSGRRSPYFFNAGEFHDGRALDALGAAYAGTIVDAGFHFDVLFGPAYKGIPLAVATGIALAREHGIDCGIAYNRKERKDHGEGGQLVGAPLTGRVLLVDDVITAGTAIREVLPLIEDAGGELVGIVTALDRQERGQHGEQSATAELAASLDVPVVSIVTLADMVDWLKASSRSGTLDEVAAYRSRYGAAGEGAQA
jgi:orotate phosphoribosyltransferase